MAPLGIANIMMAKRIKRDLPGLFFHKLVRSIVISFYGYKRRLSPD
jgi:hypothetical protein